MTSNVVKNKSPTEFFLVLQKFIALFWQQVQPKLAQAQPYVQKVFVALDTYVRPHCSSEILEIEIGFVLLLLGAEFPVLFACAVAFKQTGLAALKKSLALAVDGYSAARAALEKDEEAKALLDTNNDGKVSAMEIFSALFSVIVAPTDTQLEVEKKRFGALARCLDPVKVTAALKSFWVGMAGSVAATRSNAAYCFSMGSKIGEKIGDTLSVTWRDDLLKRFPKHGQWVDFDIRLGGAVLGILLGVMVQRILGVVGSAVMGASMLVSKLVQHLNEQREVKEEERTMMARPILKAVDKHDIKLEDKGTVLVWVVAVMGIGVQLLFSPPAFVTIPFAPLYVVEGVLSWVLLA